MLNRKPVLRLNRRDDGLFTIASRNQIMVLDGCEMTELVRAYDRIFYREDIIDYFCVRYGTPYDGDRLKQDAALVERMTDYYAGCRENHCTGGDEDMVAHWTVSMEETENAFQPELQKYFKAAGSNDDNSNNNDDDQPYPF